MGTWTWIENPWGYSNNFVGKTCHRFSPQPGEGKELQFTQRNRNEWWKRLPHKELGGGNSNIFVFTPIPIWGKMNQPILTIIFLRLGWLKPPTFVTYNENSSLQRFFLLLLLMFFVAKTSFLQPIQRKPPHLQHLKPGNPPGKSPPTHPPWNSSDPTRWWSLVLARDTWDFCWRIYGQTFPWSSWRWRWTKMLGWKGVGLGCWKQ